MINELGAFRSWTENPRVGGSIPPLATIKSRSIPDTWVRRSQWVSETLTFIECFKRLAVLRRPIVAVPPESLALVKAKRFRVALPRVRHFAPSPGALTEPLPR